jgi:hypothetical protein
MHRSPTRSLSPLAVLVAGTSAVLFSAVAHAQCGGGGSCFATHNAPGCDNAVCCGLVCELDSFCCATAWDGICVGEAEDLCSTPTIIGGPVVNPMNGHRYSITSPSTMPMIQSFLSLQSASLAAIKDGAENDWIRRAVVAQDPSGNPAMYIGLNDIASEGAFVWSTGEPLTYLNWGLNEPDNFLNEDAAQMYAPNGTWNDIPKTSILAGVAEASTPQCGTGGPCTSTHGPGCDEESCCNQVCGFDVFCCETAWDGICVNEANERCVAQTISPPIVNPATGSRYYLVSDTTWLTAEKLALSMGGNLTSIENPQENEWIRANFSTFSNMTSAWIGLHDQRYENLFQWSSSEPTFYTNWSAGEPNNIVNEDFGTMLFTAATSGKWNDAPSSMTTFAIVEVPCGGDLNGDLSTDAADLGTLLGAWGHGSTVADLNRDAIVDAADLSILLGAWGPCPTSNACESHFSTGSDQPGCTLCVCNLDPFCCNTRWDSLCANEASDQCQSACQCE